MKRMLYLSVTDDTLKVQAVTTEVAGFVGTSDVLLLAVFLRSKKNLEIMDITKSRYLIDETNRRF